MVQIYNSFSNPIFQKKNRESIRNNYGTYITTFCNIITIFTILNISKCLFCKCKTLILQNIVSNEKHNSLFETSTIKLMEQEVANKYNVPILEKGMELLEILSTHHNGLTIQEMCKCLDHSKTSIYRIASTFLEMGYLIKDEENNRFLLSRKIFRLGLAALGEANILERAIEPMKRLRDEVKESVMLATLVGNEAVLLEQVLGAHDFTFMLRSGTHLCLHASAPGKILLAYQNKDVRKTLLENLSLKRFNDNTITDPIRFRKELEAIVKNGYGTDIEEEIIGVHCIGAPIFNQYGEIVACVWISGPKGRMPVGLFPELSSKVRNCADTISAKLAYKKI